MTLDGVVGDLAQPHGGIGARLGSGLTSLAGHLAPRNGYPSLRLPDAASPTLVVGRSRSCDVILDEPTVSRVHAAFMLFAGQWFVSDRDSTNGTRVNGRRIWGTASVSPGDQVSFGDAVFRLAGPTGR
jgi:pSer/pThr/pTyr-binding forkhead associated (FHA) protein